MTTASSGLSPEAKEFVPLVQNPTPSIPLYVDENTVASIYPSDQQPLMVQTIYPMMITNSKITDNLQFPEIEFHIQPSQQQQFHIDSCTNIQQQQQQSSCNGNTSSTNTSQIVLLPITNPTNSITLTGYYPEPQIIYSTNEQVSTYYPVDYCEQPLINFSLQQPTLITKSNRISSQQQRSTSFRQHHGTNHSIHRPLSRGGNRGGSGHNNNRNSYYDYNNRRNCSSYIQNSGRGNSTNSKRISSYHQHDYNNYYHSSSSLRSRGYLSRTSQQYDERRKDHFHDYYNQENDFYENDSQQSSHINDDGTQFEFRPEDFPSLPINNQPSDKTSSSMIMPTNTKPTSSWNTIVSASRPRSTSPHSVLQSQDQRSDRSRSFNNKLSSNNERKSSIKKPILETKTTTKSPNRASKNHSPEKQQQQQRSQSLINNNPSIIENNIQKDDTKDDGFIQTKQQHRRLKRRNKNKEESSTSLIEQSLTNETAPYILDDENAFPTLGQQTSHLTTTNQKTENDSTQELIHKSNSKTHQTCLTDMFNTLSTTTQENSNHKTSTITINNTTNSFDSKSISKNVKEREQPKSRKSTKLKRSINKEFEDSQKQRQESFSKVIIEKSSDEKIVQNETDTNIENVIETDHQNSNPLSSSSNNSSDTSDYDDAVDNFDDE
ncbi:unnamed protein product [Rotaria sordida]|uniref:Uncharacterized protein n=1 Tax=Rotaria sordida TaxID=392033 RepID=A0A814K5D4_9BILA|nr:unnamed protein product [Rotaria sordida]CAF1204681.1 unnamed protein product [Rotaria sordida]